MCVCVFGDPWPRVEEGEEKGGEVTIIDACWSMHGYIVCNKEVAPPKVNPPHFSSFSLFYFCFLLGPGEREKRKNLGL